MQKKTDHLLAAQFVVLQFKPIVMAMATLACPESVLAWQRIDFCIVVCYHLIPLTTIVSLTPWI